jgi:hypothetical protein
MIRTNRKNVHKFSIFQQVSLLPNAAINKMTGSKRVYYPPKMWNVIQQRWGGVYITLHNSVIVPD